MSFKLALNSITAVHECKYELGCISRTYVNVIMYLIYTYVCYTKSVSYTVFSSRNVIGHLYVPYL